MPQAIILVFWEIHQPSHVLAGVCNWRYAAKISPRADLEAPKYIFSVPLQSTAMPF